MEKDIISVKGAAVGTSLTQKTLYTCAERCTLTRIVGNVSLAKGGGTQGAVALAITRVPEGGSALELDLTDGNQLQDAPERVLWHQTLMMHADVEGPGTINIPIDVRGQRKLRQGDIIMLKTKADSADAADLAGSLTTFVKLA